MFLGFCIFKALALQLASNEPGKENTQIMGSSLKKKKEQKETNEEEKDKGGRRRKTKSEEKKMERKGRLGRKRKIIVLIWGSTGEPRLTAEKSLTWLLHPLSEARIALFLKEVIRVRPQLRAYTSPFRCLLGGP